MNVLKHVSKVRVRYADTDQMKVVYHGRYFEYFEQARGDMLRGLGLPYAEIERQGVLIVVIEAFAKYKKSLTYDDLLEIETTVREAPVAKIRIEYRVFREGDPDPFVEGYTVHSFLNAATGRATRAPAQLIQLIEEALNVPGQRRA